MDYNQDEMLIELDGFTAPCRFQFGVGESRAGLNIGCINVTSEVKAPFTVKSSINIDHVACLKELVAPHWGAWREIVSIIEAGGGELLVCDHQAIAYLTGADPAIAAALIDCLSTKTTSPPFVVLDASALSTRLSDQADFVFDSKRVPSEISDLIPFALEWCIADEGDIMKYARQVGSERIRDFVRAFFERAAEVNAFCNYIKGGGVPTEVMVFQLAGQAFALLKEMGSLSDLQ